MGSRGKCVGIVREVYNKWERRAPLCPSHVEQLSKRGIQVIVQPSTSRIFPDEEYRRAGAEISENLEKAELILGVKQVEADSLIPGKTYMFFSHTIKGQEQNMPLLEQILDKKNRLIDYECITEGGQRGGRRLIAFGDYAGKAGMIDTCRGLGERLLSLGYSTPFLNVGSAYMYPNLEVARSAVYDMGQQIKRKGLPADLAPMTFVFTGNGNVSKGAQGIFSLLPHVMVDPSELPKLPRDRHTLYSTVVTEKDMVRRKDGGPYSRDEYREYPERYSPVFHQTIAPYSSVIMNCAYWDHRYPRLLSFEQLEDLWEGGKKKLIAVGDLSCDVNGSIECLTMTTDIEKPFFLYDVKARETREELDGDGVMMLGVDILPSELPVEASQHFGDLLVRFVDKILSSDGQHPTQSQTDLPQELQAACIAADGKLTPGYQYIEKIKEEQKRSKEYITIATEGSTCLHLRGHLFDSGLINEVLNVIEKEGGQFHLVEVEVAPNTGKAFEVKSSAILQVTMAAGRDDLERVLERVHEQVARKPEAEAVIKELRDHCRGDYSKTLPKRRPSEKDQAAHSHTKGKEESGMRRERKERQEIVVFGAGLVSKPLIEYLSRDPTRRVTVVSALKGEAQAMINRIRRPNLQARTCDVVNRDEDRRNFVETADVVVSLLPASLHLPIAEDCIQARTPLVHASYISPEMKELHQRAQEADIPILCEMGLDPGMDHMSAMRIIDDIKERGGSVVSFRSLCGGLPSPEAADNPLAYKFSWSPMGVITAAQNAARFRLNGEVIDIPGKELLASAQPTRVIPSLALEEIPNRNSLPYGELYGISDASTVYRGTLRYAGWCSIMYRFKQLGLLEKTTANFDLWKGLLLNLGVDPSSEDDATATLRWLGLLDGDTKLEKRGSGTVVESFCALLEKKLAYNPGERDMAVMSHEIIGLSADKREREVHQSTFLAYGASEQDGGGDTIMAKTVGLTAAVGAELVLERAFKATGVLAPVTREIYEPALERLAAEGLTFKERMHKEVLGQAHL